MSLAELIGRDPDATTLKLWLEKIPYAVYLGMEAELHDNDILFRLPPDDKLIGNASLPAIHGGVVGAFMELAGSIHLVAHMKKPVLPKIINFSLDYLRASRLQDTWARCEVIRQGRQIANVTVTAWQEDPANPNATARAHFLIAEPENSKESSNVPLET
ncbi:MAG: PaaI family thioesterase [Halieaceae bacterium]|nr:PaaI family thioesterase [Halieaceae bacterium]